MLLILLVFAIIIAIISFMEALFITAMVMALGFEGSLFIAFVVCCIGNVCYGFFSNDDVFED